MLDAHIDGGLGCTVAGIRVPRSQATAFGVIDAAADNKIKEFLEKPVDPPGLPDDPEASFASMGNYIFTSDALVDALNSRRGERDSRHDMGGDIIPSFVNRGEAQVYDFTANAVPGIHRPGPGLLARRRDASTPTTRRTWTWCRSTRCSTSTTTSGRSGPIRCRCPGAKFTLRGSARLDRQPRLHRLRRFDRDSVLSPNVRVRENAKIDQSVLLSNVWIGEERRRPQGDPGQERRRRPTAPRSASTTRPTAPAATPSPRAASPSSARASRSASEARARTRQPCTCRARAIELPRSLAVAKRVARSSVRSTRRIRSRGSRRVALDALPSSA